MSARSTRCSAHNCDKCGRASAVTLRPSLGVAACCNRHLAVSWLQWSFPDGLIPEALLCRRLEHWTPTRRRRCTLASRAVLAPTCQWVSCTLPHYPQHLFVMADAHRANQQRFHRAAHRTLLETGLGQVCGWHTAGRSMLLHLPPRCRSCTDRLAFWWHRPQDAAAAAPHARAGVRGRRGLAAVHGRGVRPGAADSWHAALISSALTSEDGVVVCMVTEFQRQHVCGHQYLAAGFASCI